MKSSSLYKVMGCAGIAVGFCLAQGCRTVHSGGGEAEDMRLRPLPGALEPVQSEVVTTVVTPREVPVTPVEPRVRPPLTTAYTVKKGDTVSAIAYRYKLRWQDVAAVNPGLNVNRVQVGQTIALPGQVDIARPLRAAPVRGGGASAVKPVAGGQVYTVQAGDSLSVIAHRHGVKTAALRQANKLSGDLIRVNQKLVIPGGAGATQAAPAVPPSALPEVPAPAPVPPTPAVAPDAAAVPVDTPVPVPAPTEPGLVPVPAPVAPAPVAPAPVVGANYQTHTVAAGEDLYAVAIRWGVSPTDIKVLNNLSGSELTVGSVLKIPPAPTP
jgi:LysM repeat protein